MTTDSAAQLVYVGTYTHSGAADSGRSEGIFIYEFDPISGALTRRGAVRDVLNPSFLTISKDRRRLFAVNEYERPPEMPEGGVSAFAIDRDPALPTFLNRQSSHGEAPCYVTLDATEQWAFVANYTSGTVAVYPVGEDGRLGAATHILQNQGHSVVPGRQESAHAHCAVFDPSQRFVLVADLGIDQIQVFRFDAAAGRLLPNDPPSVAAAPGAGPRHLEFHPGGRWLYVTNELNSTVSAYAWDSGRGTLTHAQTVSSLPEGFDGWNSMADLHCSRDGRFLYASNRGHDSIIVLSVEPETGALTPVEIVPTGGRTPRNFALDLTGRYLLAANQDSDLLVVFARNPDTGRLTPTGASAAIPSPVCVKPVMPPG